MTETVLVNGRLVSANDYQAQAGGAAGAVDPGAAHVVADEMRRDHAFAARAYWARAYVALSERRWNAMRACAAQARAAQEAASPEGVLLAAIFGGCAQPADPGAVARGREIPEDLAAQARRAVVSEMDRYAAAAREKRAAAEESRRSERAAARRAADRQRDAELPQIGAIVTVRVPYKMKKRAGGRVGIVDLEQAGVYALIECEHPVADGARLRVVSQKCVRSYGLRVELQGEKE